jgi:hypothetical protein
VKKYLKWAFEGEPGGIRRAGVFGLQLRIEVFGDHLDFSFHPFCWCVAFNKEPNWFYCGIGPASLSGGLHYQSREET